MVIKVYISGTSGNKEVKKRQQRVLLILDSKNVNYEVIDIAEPGAEEAKDFVQNNATSMGATISDPSPRHPLPPQIFNDDDYCGDYDQFDMANEVDEMEKFLKLQLSDAADSLISNAEIKLKNGELTPTEKESSKEEEKELAVAENEKVEGEIKESAEREEISETKADEEVSKKDEEPKEEEEKKEEADSGSEQADVETKILFPKTMKTRLMHNFFITLRHTYIYLLALMYHETKA
ncbi:hypothetical protein NQ318_019584 [Aromia moschata]|uniref:SH3 domain-binding glutamic acid-rich protein n=1 Tax=Aromia moschata TaxID=1265417 RepID=A0AAV8Z3T0_9CUCU|nr:hypothetical protein NQ318_019584 [Aromia moschata]